MLSHMHVCARLAGSLPEVGHCPWSEEPNNAQPYFKLLVDLVQPQPVHMDLEVGLCILGLLASRSTGQRQEATLPGAYAGCLWD